MSSRALRALVALPLLFTLPAQRDPLDQCEAWQESDFQVAPILVSRVAADRPVPLADYAVLATEIFQVATRGLNLGRDLLVPLDTPILFPAGTPLRPVNAMQRFDALCLPLIPPSIAPPPSTARQGTGLLVCPSDADHDGRYDQVDLYDTDFRMHVPQVNFVRSVTLDAPLPLVEDPEGRDRTRRHIHRRIEAFPVRGDTARLLVQHAFHDLDLPEPPGEFVAGPDGVLAWRAGAVQPAPAEPDDGNLPYRLSDTEQPAEVTLADGATVEAGGLAFRVARAGNAWTMTPLADRFPGWIRFGCGGRSIILGPSP